MFRVLELLENLEPSKRLFGAKNEFGRTFLWERWHLSTRKTGAKTVFSLSFLLFPLCSFPPSNR